MSFPQALIYSGTRLPIDALLAVRVGFETGTLSESLRRVARFDSDLDSLIRSVFEKAMYLIWIWIALIILLAFVFLRIIPVFSQMFREFGIPLPGMTQLLVTTSETAAPYLVLTIPLVLVLLLAALGGSLYYIDLLPYGAPGVQWIRRRLDGVLVMRVLSLAVSCGWPMNRTIWLLARVYPTGPIRKRLARAGRLVDDGQDWCGSLRQVGLLRQADWAVLKSATRVGNLEWALEEMADGSLRRSVYRMRLLISFIFPTTLFLCGLFVGYVAIALFVPLISLVQGLT
jgi:type II secretory pathway component PulF